MSGGHRTNESAPPRVWIAIALVVLASAVAVTVVGIGSGTAVATTQENESSPPELHSGEKINDTAVELLFVDDVGVDTGSIDRDDFLLTDGVLETLNVRRNASNATVVLRLDAPLAVSELTVGVRPGSDIQDVNGNEIETSDGPPSVTITGMDGVPPRPIGTNVTDARGRPAHIEFNFDERLENITVTLDGPVSTVLTIDDFENPTGSRYVAEYDPPQDGDYELVLVNATDVANNTRELDIRRAITARRSTPRTVIGIDFAESEGTNITFDGRQSDDSVVNFTWEFGDGTTATGSRVTHEFAYGVYTVTLTARDGHGNVGRDQLELNLTNGLDVTVPDRDPSERTSVTVDRSASTADAMVTVRGARANRPIRVGTAGETGDPLLVHESFTLDGLAVTPSENVNFTLALSASGPGSVTDAEGNGTEALGGLTVIHDVADTSVESAELTFSVAAERLGALDVPPENVTLHREHDGTWQSLDTSVVSQSDDSYRFAATTPGFSRFAILATEETESDDGDRNDDSNGDDDNDDDSQDENTSAVTVTNAELNETTIRTGDVVEITATLENEGQGTAEFLAGLDVDGRLVDTQRESQIAGGSSVTTTFTRQFDDPGTYTLAVNGTETAPLTVEPQETDEDESSDQEDGEDGDDSDGENEESGDGGQASSATGNFNVTEVTVNTTEIAPGGTVEITAAVKNQNTERANFTAGLEIDGELATVQAVPAIPGGASIPATFDRQFNESGTYNVSVNGTAGQQPIVVEEGGGGGLFGFLPLGFLPLGLLRTVFLFIGAPVLVVYLALKAVAFYMGY